MNQTPEKNTQPSRSPSARLLVSAAAVLAVVQACLTIEGRGIEGFVLWVLILFVGYWLLLTFLVWAWRRYRDRN
jgi:hypothetical protein